jgi:superfamily II DNA or RNA helicase
MLAGRRSGLCRHSQARALTRVSAACEADGLARDRQRIDDPVGSAGVSLADQLTRGYLWELGAYPRGEAYFDEGRVQALVVTAGAVDGTVIGSAAYHARIELIGGALRSACTCPVGGGCKHVVALGLAYLAGSGVAAEPASPPAGREAVAAWAIEHGVAHALDLAAETLHAWLPAARAQAVRLHGLALRDTAAADRTARYFGRAVADELAAATRARLDHEAALVAEAIREERAPRPCPAPPLARLHAALVGLRAELRGQASPRSRSWRQRQKWAFDRRERAVTWQELEPIVLPLGVRQPPSAALTIRGGAPVIECTCRARTGCAHGLALVDATLDVLEHSETGGGDPDGSAGGAGGRAPRGIESPARAEHAAELAAELYRPAWSRALVELAAYTAAEREPAAVEVWWEIGDELRIPTLTAIVKKRTRRGLSAGSRRSAHVLLAEHRDRLPAEDRAIAEALVAWRAAPRSGSYPAQAFAAAVGHPRLLGEDGAPVALARIALGFAAVPEGDGVRLRPTIDGEPVDEPLASALRAAMASGEPVLVQSSETGGGDPDGAGGAGGRGPRGINERGRDRFVLVELPDGARRLWGVLHRHGDWFPPESHDELLAQLARLDGQLPVSVPSALRGTQARVATRPVVRLRLLPDATLELELFVRAAPGTPLYAPGAGPRDVIFADAGARAYARRDLAAEPALARAALARLVGEPAIAEEGPPGCFRICEPDAALALVARLDGLSAELDAEWLDEPPLVIGTFGPSALRVGVRRDRDWFGIVGELKVEHGRIELAVLLDAARRQQRYVRVDSRRWVALSDELREALRAVADRTFASRQGLELSPGAVPAIAALSDAGAAVDAAPPWVQLTERLAAASRLRPRPPATLRTALRDYQIEGHAWLSRMAAWGAGACLADDMGLGKTVQAIALLLDRARLGPALVVAPTSVCFNWVDELARFAPALRPVVYAEATDRAACVAALGKKDVLIATYGLVVRDAERLRERTFATLVLDEAQAVKNAQTRRARAARSLRAEFRVALSGTPLENHLGELWSLFAAVFPGLLGSWDQFRDRFASPIERNARGGGDPDGSAGGAGGRAPRGIERGQDPEARAALARVIRPFLLRRTKQQVARELPPRTEIVVPIALSGPERALYEDARLAAVAELADMKGLRDEQRRFQVLAALTRLRLLASHPRLYDRASPVASSKLRRLIELVGELRTEGHRALVFSQFTSHLALVRDALTELAIPVLYLDGETPAAQRKLRVQAFQAGEADVFLISLTAGGTGLNLTAADYVFHLDPWWNPAVEDQATDRAHRIGQDRPVTVYRLIARGTIEDKILALHADKRALIAGVLEGTSVAARLTTRDLLALISSSPAPHAAEPSDDLRDDEPAPRPVPHLRLVP